MCLVIEKLFQAKYVAALESREHHVEEYKTANQDIINGFISSYQNFCEILNKAISLTQSYLQDLMDQSEGFLNQYQTGEVTYERVTRLLRAGDRNSIFEVSLSFLFFSDNLSTRQSERINFISHRVCCVTKRLLFHSG